MTNYLNTVRKVDNYISARADMTVYQDVVKLAVANGKCALEFRQLLDPLLAKG